MVEHSAVNRNVVGSSPTRGANFFCLVTNHREVDSGPGPLWIGVFLYGCGAVGYGGGFCGCRVSVGVGERERFGGSGLKPEESPSLENGLEIILVHTDRTRMSNLCLSHLAFSGDKSLMGVYGRLVAAGSSMGVRLNKAADLSEEGGPSHSTRGIRILYQAMNGGSDA